MNFRPVLFIAVAISLGIAAAYFLVCGFTVAAICVPSILGLVMLVSLLLFTNKSNLKRNAIFILVMIITFVLGWLIFERTLNNFVDADLHGHYYQVTATVEEVSPTETGSRLILSNATVSGNVSGKLKYKIALYVYNENDVKMGDIITFSEHLTDYGVFYDGKFSAYNIADRIKYFASINPEGIEVLGKTDNLFINCRERIKNTLEQGLNKNVFPIAYAMLVGNSDYMDTEVITSYRQSGVAHIFAVSGLHIGFLATALGFLFRIIKLKRGLRAVVTTLMLVFYAGVCGFSASSVRAVVMSAIMLFSSAFGERYDGLSSVSLAAIIVLLIEPSQLFCVGFQLSFAVVIGIILLALPISRLFRILPPKISSSLGTVIAAQIVGIPISLAAFGEFSAVAIIANLLLIPVIGIVFIALFIAVILGAIFSVPIITLFLPNYALYFINLVITAFDYEIFMVGGFSMGAFIIAYYIAILTPCGLFNLKKITAVVVSLVASITCVLGTVFTTEHNINQTKVMVSGSERLCAAAIYHEQHTVLVISDVEYAFSLSSIKRLKTKEKIYKIDTLIFTNGAVSDIQSVITRLRTVYSINDVVYYGKQNKDLELAITMSFPKMNVKSLSEDKEYSQGNVKINYALDGYVVEYHAPNINIAVFGTFNNSAVNYTSLDKKYDVMIAKDGAENILSYYQPNVPISFRKSSLFLDGETAGNLVYSFG